jgi:hypothetical protein
MDGHRNNQKHPQISRINADFSTKFLSAKICEICGLKFPIYDYQCLSVITKYAHHHFRL